MCRPRGGSYPNPFYLPAWELLNMYAPSGGSWWGHCNGWAAAATLTNEPRASLAVTAGGHAFTFTTADQKGLLTEAHYSTYSHFYGERYNGEDDDIADLSPAAFQKIVSFYIKEQGVPLVFDTTAGDAVWNFPAHAVELMVQETTPAGLADLVNINTADLAKLAALPGIGEALSVAIVEHREANGPFQNIKELMNVDGIGEGRFEDLAQLITVDPFQRTFDVISEVTFTSGGVDETHVETGAPESFSET